MKKWSCVISMICVLVLFASVCCAETVTKSGIAEGMIFSGKAGDKVPLEMTFDPEWITTGDNTVYQPALAQFCALMSTDTYFREKDLAKDRPIRVLFDDCEEYTMTSFLSEFGFENAEHVEFQTLAETATDPCDAYILNIGHQVVADQYDVYAVALRGCFQWDEWCSAFDPGSGNEAYERMTGSHPEWTHREIIKGIDVSANRALAYIQDYMAAHNDPSLPDCILLTGHSRGGMMAAVLGAYFEQETEVRPYTYAFNTMPMTLDADAVNRKTIFNVHDADDLMTDLMPFGEEKFYRFGTVRTLAIASDEAARAALAELKGRDDFAVVPAEAAAEYRELFGKLFPNRDMLCDPETVTWVFETADEAQARLDECLVMIGAESGLAIDDLCTVGEIGETAEGKASLTFEYCGLTLLRSYGRIMAYGASAYDLFTNLFAENETACRLASVIMDNAVGLNGGHRLANSYLIAGMLE